MPKEPGEPEDVAIDAFTEAQQRELDEIVKATKDLPRVNGADLTHDEIELRENAYRTVVEGGRRVGWCNNFHNLFLELYAKSRKPERRLTVSTSRLEHVESLGDRWTLFLQTNKELLEDIFTVLDRYALMDRFRQFTLKILREHRGNLTALRPVDEKFDPIVGADSIPMAFWKEFDPLLRQAWQAMEKAGIDPNEVDR